MFRAVLLFFVALSFALSVQAEVKVEKTAYKGWNNCYRVSNGEVELIVTGDVGPRVIRFGFVGGQNLFKEFTDQMGMSGEEKFQLRGGDRVWKAPEDPIATWAYTNLADKRLTFTKQYLVLRQDPMNSEAQKVGLFNRNTWAVYLLNGEAFVKRATADPTKIYTDFGCSFETFTNNEFLEIETLGPLTKVEPGHTVEQVEQWSLARNVNLTQVTDDAIDGLVLPLLRAGRTH